MKIKETGLICVKYNRKLVLLLLAKIRFDNVLMEQKLRVYSLEVYFQCRAELL